jgi:uncharacterized membrane protein
MRGVITNRTVTALYHDFAAAQEVVDDLVSMGFQREQISVVVNNVSGQYDSYVAPATEEDVSTGEGASFGAVVGGLIGLGAMVIPGIGPVIAAGPLVAALVGAGVGAATGAVTGGLIAGLVDMGIPETEAGYYAEGIRRGGTLVIVNTTEDWVDRVVDVMESHNPIDVEERATEWRTGGWTGFDASAAPYTESQLEADREAYREFITEGEEERRRTRIFEDATG